MTYVQFTILIPEGPDFHEVHYTLENLGFKQDGMNSMSRSRDAAKATWEAIPEEALYDGLQ